MMIVSCKSRLASASIDLKHTNFLKGHLEEVQDFDGFNDSLHNGVVQ